MIFNRIIRTVIVLFLTTLAVNATPVQYDVFGQGIHIAEDTILSFMLSGIMEIEEPYLITPIEEADHFLAYCYEITNFDFIIEETHYTGTGQFYPGAYTYDSLTFVCENDAFGLYGSNGFYMNDESAGPVFYHEDGTPYYATLSSVPFSLSGILEYGILPDRVIDDTGIEFEISGGKYYLQSWEWKKVSSVPEPSILCIMSGSLCLLLPFSRLNGNKWKRLSHTCKL